MSDLLLTSLNKFYSNEKYHKELFMILENNDISLRLIDWFVTIYS